VLWNCKVRDFAPPGAAGLFAQRGHVPFGLKEGRARCRTSRRFRSKEEKGKKEKKRKCICKCDNKVQLRARDDTLPTSIYLSLSPTSIVLWNCRVWGIAPPGAAGRFAQRGHVPFGLKEGRARCTTPRWVGKRGGEKTEDRIREKQKVSECATECDCVSARDTLPPVLPPPHPKC
jgi:hypothetical protein